MPFKPPGSPSNRESSAAALSRSATPADNPKKHAQQSPAKDIFHGIQIFILQAKLDTNAVAELVTLAEQCGAKLARTIEEADVVVTAISMRKRLERHLDWDFAVRFYYAIDNMLAGSRSNVVSPLQKSKSVVKPAWLYESIRQRKALPCSAFAAVSSLHRLTAVNCSQAGSDGETLHTSIPHVSMQSLGLPSRQGTTAIPANFLPPVKPYAFNKDTLDPRAYLSCLRASPLVCVNQQLCEELDVMRQMREADGEDMSALSYRRAVSVRGLPLLIAISVSVSETRCVVKFPSRSLKVQPYTERKKGHRLTAS